MRKTKIFSDAMGCQRDKKKKKMRITKNRLLTKKSFCFKKV